MDLIYFCPDLLLYLAYVFDTIDVVHRNVGQSDRLLRSYEGAAHGRHI
jgi:hypothetical protein